MPKKQQALPGRKSGHQPTVKQMVEHYAAMIEERADMTDAEKKKAVERYKRGLEEGGTAQE